MMSEEQMIYIIRNGLIHTLQTKYRNEVMEFAFGKDYMDQPDDLKSSLQSYGYTRCLEKYEDVEWWLNQLN